MHFFMDGPDHPCLVHFPSFDDAINTLHPHSKLVVELNMDSITVKSTRNRDNSLVVEFAWSAPAIAEFYLAPVTPEP